MNAISLSLSAAVLLALSTFACASPSAEDATTAASDDAPTGQTSSALASTGFTCGPHGCACDPTAGSDDPFFNCDGMDAVCKAMGSSKTCSTDPKDGSQMCHCLFLATTATDGSTTTTNPTSPIRTTAPISATTK